MRVFPAIDLKEGKAVRLLQGRMEDSTVYADNPLNVAQDFYRQGSKYLHVVDLDGAFAGEPVNKQVIKEIVQTAPLKVQVGGGVRTLERIEELLRLGVHRVILGTIAVKSPEIVKEAVQRFGGEHIVVGIDAKDGKVAVQGWAQTTEISAVDLGKAMKEVGVRHIVYTDISRDGMLKGVNVESTVHLAKETGLGVVASGGVSTLDDLRSLGEAVENGSSIEGVIIGKALYSGAFTLSEALKTLQQFGERG